MSLPDFIKGFDDYGEFQILDYTTVSDGYGGAVEPTYVPGATFMGALVLNNSIQAQTAQKQGVTGVYTLTFDKSMHLPWHTVFQKIIRDENGNKVSNGSIYRVTTKDDNAPPKSATLKFRQVTAEEWQLPVS